MPSSAHEMRMRIRIALSFSAALLCALPARADRRSFVRAYEYATQPAGNLEVEIWNDIETPKQGGLEASTLTQRIELEYGLTDHWDLALYHVFVEPPGSTGVQFDSWRLESRYRLSDKGVWPVDVMLYLEGERPAALAEPFELEEKLILAKDVGAWGFVANFVAEQKLLHGYDGHLWEIDLGARYEVLPQLRLAAEAWTIQQTAQGVTTGSYYAGPSINVATQKFWFQIGFGVGLGDNSGAAQIRSVLGFNL